MHYLSSMLVNDNLKIGKESSEDTEESPTGYGGEGKQNKGD